ncbi:hypothetical protein SAMN02745823_03225 [Sporobacter termitidis DSM 10068]|uniref:Lipoprotein n=1 Tax=Sporobacter termitidis DSM 10068 TaxID=1123282 RepID=A0A1M5Z5N4_9FIRM|nr:hypothetical protein [Sporobacter termitidis]SHI19203.1 hypothetical protein SAMN02745823_03225 [Sporobacter termitidis DSM 10068]
MKKAWYLILAVVMVCVLAGCNVAPNVPGVTPYASPGTYTSPAYGNNLGRAYNNLTRGNSLTRGATNGATNGMPKGTSNGAVKPGAPGTYGSGSNVNSSKKTDTPTSRMNRLMNQRAYININPGDSAAFDFSKR